MNRIHLQRRLTHSYVGTFKHLDRHQPVGVVKATPGRWIAPAGDDPDLSEGGTTISHVRLPAGLSRRARQRYALAIADTLSAWGCACERDCCGHASYSARVTLRGRDALVRTSITYNY